MFLYGKNSVFERLKANPKSIQKIFLQDNFKESSLEGLIKKNNIFFVRLSLRQLIKIKPAPNLKGIVARIDNFKYAYFENLLNRPDDKKLTLIFLDRVYDPQNLGAIMRTCACFGGFAIVIPKHKACQITDTVLHIAQGAENYVLVSMVSNLSNAIISAKKNGYWIMGASAKEGEDIGKISIPFPLGIIFGSEGEGIRYGVNKHLDLNAHIPMPGAKLSLNVNLACAIFCHEITKQKRIF